MRRLREILNTRFILIFIFTLCVATFAVAQGEEPAPPDGVLGQLIIWVLSATGITLISQILFTAGLGGIIPSWAKPFVGPAFGLLAGVVSSTWGIVADFGPIMGVLLGTTATQLFDAAKGFSILKSTG